MTAGKAAEMSSATLSERRSKAMGIEMPDSDVITRLINLSADIAMIKSTVSRLDTVIGNGGGLVAKVNRLEAAQARDRDNAQVRFSQVWDYVKAHRGKTIAASFGGSSAVLAVVKGLEEFWRVTHAPLTAQPAALLPAAYSFLGIAGVTIVAVAFRNKGEN